MTNAVVERAPAKINLHLRIVSREPDGFHRLETIFQALELHDLVEVAAADALSLRVEGGIDVGPEDENLAMRAARAFLAAVPDAPRVSIRLTKWIPAGAGLGGGSSDAAATLRALDRLTGSPLSTARLKEIGVRLGSDVPYFLGGSPLARARGRGELLEPLRPFDPAPVVVVDPGFPVATGDAFTWWDQRRQPAPAETPVAPSSEPVRSFSALTRHARNDFEDVVFDRYPSLARIKATLIDNGASHALLSGSGSCVYGIFDDESTAESAADVIRPLLPAGRILTTRTVSGASPVGTAR